MSDWTQSGAQETRQGRNSAPDQRQSIKDWWLGDKAPAASSSNPLSSPQYTFGQASLDLDALTTPSSTVSHAEPSASPAQHSFGQATLDLNVHSTSVPVTQPVVESSQSRHTFGQANIDLTAPNSPPPVMEAFRRESIKAASTQRQPPYTTPPPVSKKFRREALRSDYAPGGISFVSADSGKGSDQEAATAKASSSTSNAISSTPKQLGYWIVIASAILAFFVGHIIDVIIGNEPTDKSLSKDDVSRLYDNTKTLVTGRDESGTNRASKLVPGYPKPSPFPKTNQPPSYRLPSNSGAGKAYTPTANRVKATTPKAKGNRWQAAASIAWSLGPYVGYKWILSAVAGVGVFVWRRKSNAQTLQPAKE